MTVDHYRGGARRWAEGATLVYGPIASELVAMSPHPLSGRTVLDVGAGTGVASTALRACGAFPLATDLSLDMLRWDRESRPPSFVADISTLPLADNSVEDTVAAFVLNHLTDPLSAMTELARVTRADGAVLAAVYSNASQSPVRDRVDQVALEAGWQAPGWYVELKATAVPLLGSAESMADTAERAGLTCVVVDERQVEVGVHEPEQLADYRFGQAHFAGWMEEIGPSRAENVRAAAIRAIRPVMEPYRPIVVFLSARAGPEVQP